ncbi:DODA-type extradiol aromatic ring-opening family dioxygenase [Crenobacter intestini]|uniref:Dioxygenase n=1 Tax=Crenobacter intestini TaxID=2563443 RepID=A0A4T0UVP5_9NEIS|nr:class III extradiol ring-cleavage dioxygenase [Crenobacter intestini]TIC83142.1 dioxygenase [Crenobacter intestini]
MRLPTLFVSHGAPTLALEAGPDAALLASLPATLAPVRAVLVVSAHLQARGVTLSATPAPRTVHDFYGFPAPLYRLSYPATGSAWLAGEVEAALAAAGIACGRDDSRGIDHGVWVPLMKMWPAADVPVVTLALPHGASAAELAALGAALSVLPDEGVLVLGSGGYVHNLSELAEDGSAPPAWARAFAAWLDDALRSDDRQRLLDWEGQAPFARRAHPSSEHLAPLFVALGAAGEGAQARKLFDGWRYGALSMAAFSFASPPAGARNAL